MATAKHPDTEMLHAAEGARAGARPLTTPIYATSTFVFENAAEIEAYQRGGTRAICTRVTAIPTSTPSRRSSSVLERGDAALLTSSGMAAVSTALFGLLESRRRDRLQRGDLRRHAPSHPAFFVGSASRRASRRWTRWRGPSSVIGPRTRLVWFESPINPTLRCVDIAKVSAACRAAGVMSVDRQHVREPDQPAAARRSAIDLVMHRRQST